MGVGTKWERKVDPAGVGAEAEGEGGNRGLKAPERNPQIENLL